MTRPRITTITSAALSSAAAFFVLTRSGLAGTLAGAAVASMVYTGTSHWAGKGLERAARWWLARRGRVPAAAAATPVAPPADAATGAPVVASLAGAPAAGATAAAPPAVAPHPSRRPRTWGRLARTWGPVGLAVLALGVSGYSLVTGSPLERVIVQERVVEKPVVQERVVVQKETVTVTVPDGGGQPTSSTSASTSSTSTSTTTTSPPTTTTTSPQSTTTTLAPPPTTTTSMPAPAGN